MLLSQYFFVVGRTIEGRYHANSAASLSFSAGLHRATSTSSQGQGETALFTLPPARDATELGERIRVFWQVFFLDRGWNGALGAPCVLIDDTTRGTHIDTPWPLELAAYEQAGTFHDQEEESSS